MKHFKYNYLLNLLSNYQPIRRQFVLFIISFIIFYIEFITSSFAGQENVIEKYNNYMNSYNEYYKTLKLNGNISPDLNESIKNQYITPAQNAFSQAIEDKKKEDHQKAKEATRMQSDENLRKITSRLELIVTDKEKLREIIESAKRGEIKPQANGKTQKVPLGIPSPKPKSTSLSQQVKEFAQPQSRPKFEPVVIDGSNIPREIVFGSSSQPPMPNPSSTPSPRPSANSSPDYNVKSNEDNSPNLIEFK